MKNPALLYEVSFFSALWIVFPESWKRSCPNFYAHDCTYNSAGYRYFSPTSYVISLISSLKTSKESMLNSIFLALFTFGFSTTFYLFLLNKFGGYRFRGANTNRRPFSEEGFAFIRAKYWGCQFTGYQFHRP